VAHYAGFPDFLTAWVASQPDLAALVGNRVAPQQAKRGDPLPRIEYLQVSGDRVHGLAGPLGVARQRWQVNVWGNSMSEARDVARLITGDAGDTRLDGYAGTLAGVKVQAVTLLDESEVFEALTPGDDLGTPGVQLDLDCAWNVV
jgi:hypothetical protein